MKKFLVLTSAIGFFLLGRAASAESVKSQDSPFGFLGSYIRTPESRAVYAAYGGFEAIRRFYRDLGVHWGRGAGRNGGAVWGALEKDIKGYRRIFDDYVKTAAEDDIDLIITIEPGYSRRDYGKYLPADLRAYAAFVKKLLKHYPTVKYWQIHNEINGGVFWKDTPGNYARLVEVTSKTIRETSPDCKIVLGSSVNIKEKGLPADIDSYFEPLLRTLSRSGRKYFDVFDYHFFPPRGYSSKTYYRLIKQAIPSLKALLARYGYADTEIWMTETMLFTTQGMNEKQLLKLPAEYRQISEREQAQVLIKTYILALSQGVKKIFWCKLTEGPWFDFMFDRCGLIRHPDFSGYSGKKLAYYTYKKMVEVLEGSDWDNIQTVRERDGIYIYKFMRGGRPIWVVWNDNGRPEKVTLAIGRLEDTGSVRITEFVPKYASGSEVDDYSQAFKEIKASYPESWPMRSVVFEIDDSPVFIREEF